MITTTITHDVEVDIYEFSEEQILQAAAELLRNKGKKSSNYTLIEEMILDIRGEYPPPSTAAWMTDHYRLMKYLDGLDNKVLSHMLRDSLFGERHVD